MKWSRHPGMLGFMGKISINLILELLQLWVLSGPKKKVSSKQEHIPISSTPKDFQIVYEGKI